MKTLNGFIFYKSYLEVANSLEGEDFKEFINMIAEYAISSKEPTSNNQLLLTLFAAIKPSIDGSIERYRSKNNLK